MAVEHSESWLQGYCDCCGIKAFNLNGWMASEYVAGWKAATTEMFGYVSKDLERMIDDACKSDSEISKNS